MTWKLCLAGRHRFFKGGAGIEVFAPIYLSVAASLACKSWIDSRFIGLPRVCGDRNIHTALSSKHSSIAQFRLPLYGLFVWSHEQGLFLRASAKSISAPRLNVAYVKTGGGFSMFAVGVMTPSGQEFRYRSSGHEQIAQKVLDTLRYCDLALKPL